MNPVLKYIVGTIVVGSVAFALLWFVDMNLHVHTRQAKNEAATVGAVRRINLLEVTYAAKNDGLTCKLADLDAINEENQKLFPFEMGERSGYLFNLRDCDPGHKNAKYQLVAVPKQPGITGFAAFCSDQRGAIYYDRSGSVEECFKRGTALK